ncbi:DUF1761 domain-containing protein [Amphiplicatus metriothermophilus]|uniref:DUF1761 domain-containing protein n=1 Tax=Amphiplicatus metriothermophilus TaxID=1519374 RepID=A0A239Q023_9PROT|nr:DUF1761 domain-containing protein [Amphiplicatus metriothermophilus]MBB5518288.1 signal transduction histidine kinase [Amphiplicatus metriothermophilus]SNT75542.1 Protein of unknown function [Amphiplicatus metriothermophilus]
MPKLFGLNVLAVLVASVVFYLIGWLWYGVLFKDLWMALMRVTEAEAAASSGPIWYVYGFVITVLQVIGIGLVMKWKNAAGLNAAVVTAVILWIVFALPFSGYAYVYSVAHSEKLLLIDAGHLLVGWVVSAAALALMKA